MFRPPDIKTPPLIIYCEMFRPLPPDINTTPPPLPPCIKHPRVCCSLLTKEKKNSYGNLDTSKVRDNRLFWKVVKTKLSDKVKICFKITLIEGDKILAQDVEIAKT